MIVGVGSNNGEDNTTGRVIVVPCFTSETEATEIVGRGASMTRTMISPVALGYPATVMVRTASVPGTAVERA
jgi:hypothetical protein